MIEMASPGLPKRPKLTPTDSTPVGQSPNNSTTESGNSSTDDPPIFRLPPELLSAIINYLPMSQWSGLEFVNRSFRDAVYLSWRSVKEFDVDKDVLTVRQSVNGADLSDFLPSILAKLLLRSPLLSSIIGFLSMDREEMIQSRSEILHTISQFTHLKRIDFGDIELKSTEFVEFMTSSSSRDQLKEIAASAFCERTNNWPGIFADQENRDRQASRLQLEKFSLKTEYHIVFLDPRIIDLINPSSLTQLVLVKTAAPSDYLLSLISNCQQLKQLQFSFMTDCRCQEEEEDDCVHLISSKRLLDTISGLENLTSLKIGLIDNGNRPDAGGIDHLRYLDSLDDLPILIDRLGKHGRLVEFGLLHRDYCTDQVITGIGDHLPSLKSLELFAEDCRPELLVNMIKKLVSLEKLTFNCNNSYLEPVHEEWLFWNDGITSAVLNAVATYLQHLKICHLWWLNYDIAECLHVLTRLNRLEELLICGAFFSEVKWEVNASFGQLRSLEMRECHKDLVASFLNRAPELRRLVLGGSFRPLNTVLRMIPVACQRLRQLDVADAWDEDAVRDIIDLSPDLMHLKC